MRTSLGATIGLGSKLRARQRALLYIDDRFLVLRTVPGDGAAERGRWSLEGASAEALCAAVRACLAAHPELAVEVRLASAWSRLLLLPWIAQLTREERWHNYARARFEQVYGESAEAWDIRLGRDWPGGERVAVAWPTALRGELATHAHVRSVRVALLEDLGVLLPRERQFSGCLAEITPGRAGFLLLRRGRLERVRWCRYDHTEGLAAALRTEWAAVAGDRPPAGEGSAPVFALSPPAPQPGSELAKLVAALAASIGARRAFCLPEWA